MCQSFSQIFCIRMMTFVCRNLSKFPNRFLQRTIHSLCSHRLVKTSINQCRLRVDKRPLTSKSGRLYMDSTYFTTLILHKNVNCLRIYGFSLRELPSSLRCLRTYHPFRFCSLYGLADTSGFWRVGLTFYAALSL